MLPGLLGRGANISPRPFLQRVEFLGEFVIVRARKIFDAHHTSLLSYDLGHRSPDSRSSARPCSSRGLSFRTSSVKRLRVQRLAAAGVTLLSDPTVDHAQDLPVYGDRDFGGCHALREAGPEGPEGAKKLCRRDDRRGEKRADARDHEMPRIERDKVVDLRLLRRS